MEINGKKSNLILKYCRQIFQATEKKPIHEVKLETIKTPILFFQDFFGLTDIQACILLAFMIESNFRDQNISTDTILSHFGNSLEDLSELQHSVEMLEEMKYCAKKSAKRRRMRYGPSTSKKSYTLSELVSEAVLKGDKQLLKPEPVTGIIQFAQEVAYLTNQRWEEEITTEMLLDEIKDLMEQHQSIPFVQQLAQLYLPPLELAVLWNICHRHIYYQREEIDVADILSEVEEDSESIFVFKRKLKMKGLAIQEHGFIEYKKELYGLYNMVKPTDKLLDKLYEGEADLKPGFSPKLCRMESYDSIPEEQLFFNPEEQKLISELNELMTQEKLSELQGRLKQQGYATGVNILLYGYAGTGKTASVKQWAKKNGRHVLWVEVNRIKTAWVGESEQNLQKVFDEYQLAYKFYDKAPILLFNEADAIIGRRTDVRNSVDQMENSLQNILLQNMEDFPGIFIATTNLASHLDKAFDRRFLYKVGFQKPEKNTRLKILGNAFAHLSEDEVAMLNEQFELTGGQIMNVKKRLSFQEVLSGKTPDYVTIQTFCEQELQLTKPSRTPIGFLR